MKRHDTPDSIVATLAGAVYSFVNDFQAHINFWEVGQAVICSVFTYIAIRLIRAFFPEKTKEK